jgi:phosphoribosylformylglycinamidine synthase
MTSAQNLQDKLKTYRLNSSEYELICELLKREPQGLEWALFSALWSEHCSYKSSKVHLKNLFSQSKRVVQSFGENAGVVDLGEGERIAFKIESHNHPSFIEPYQGAATGVGGILRDIFTMGARPIALANYLCFGLPNAPRMKQIVDGVVRGIGGYGNCVGVPTITGQTEFHSSYNTNVLVNAMAVGLFRPGQKIHLSQAKGPGNWVVYVGAKTGRDGVHGASMASESFDENSKSKRPTVQIGDPFFEKLLIESCLEVMDQDLVVAIQDMGAAGLTSSSFEMASKGGVGLILHLDQVPLRDPTMLPEEILLSESQERMLLVCESAKFSQIKEIFERWGLDAVKIGEVKAEREVELFWKGECVTKIDPDLLVENAPKYQRPYQPWTFPRQKTTNESLSVTDASQQLSELMRQVQGTSREWIYRQYDQRVGASTVRDCRDSVGILRLPDSKRALGIVLGCRPYVMRMDAFVGGADAILYPALELAAKGFETLAVTDCLNFGNPEKEAVMSEFVASLAGMNQACQNIEAPIISGNVSFYNETLGQNITSTPSTGLVGLRPTIDAIPESIFTKENLSVYIIRIPGFVTGGFLQEQKNGEAFFEGSLDIVRAAQFVKSVRRICACPAVNSTRVVGKYGLAYALARLCTNVGVKIESEKLGSIRPHLRTSDLFSESFYEVLVAIEPIQKVLFLEAFNQELKTLKDIEMQYLGETGGSRLQVGSLLSCELESLHKEYKEGWRAALVN